MSILDLLACDYGREISLPDDRGTPCPAQAVQRLTLHEPGGGRVAWVGQLCAHHFALVSDQTDPHRSAR